MYSSHRFDGPAPFLTPQPRLLNPIAPPVSITYDLALPSQQLTRAYELDDESFETENFLHATGEGRYCVALEPLDSLVKKPHMKELVKRRLQHLRNKGIRITNTSKVRAANHDRTEDGREHSFYFFFLF